MPSLPGPEAVLLSHSPLSNDLLYLLTTSLCKALVKIEIEDFGESRAKGLSIINSIQ